MKELTVGEAFALMLFDPLHCVAPRSILSRGMGAKMHLVRRSRSRGGAALAIALGLTLATGGISIGQTAYPEKSIKIVTITAAGSPADIVARLIGDKLSAALRQPVLVEAMVGAAGNLAVGHVAKAAPDGYTLVMSGDAAVTTNVTLYK